MKPVKQDIPLSLTQELLLVLAAGSLLGYLEDRTARDTETELDYQSFFDLRPIYASASWRGAVRKALGQRWIYRRTVNGRIFFRLTKAGQEQLWTDFATLRLVVTPESSGGTALCWWRRDREDQLNRSHYGKLYRFLEEKGAGVMNASLAIWPTVFFSQEVIAFLESLGYEASFFPIRLDDSRPHDVRDRLVDLVEVQKKSQNWRQISKEVDSLLVGSSRKKTLMPQQKARIGTAYVSGLHFCLRLRWYEIPHVSRGGDVVQLIQKIDELGALYFGSRVEER